MITRSASRHVVRGDLARPVHTRAGVPECRSAGVLDHHWRLRTLSHQLAEHLPHPLVAPAKHRSVVAIAHTHKPAR